MVVTVSISELRNNISAYLEKVAKGDRLVIRDEKKDTTIAQITHTSSFDKDVYERTLRKAAGILSTENHPEWKNKSKITSWVKKNRSSDDRIF